MGIGAVSAGTWNEKTTITSITTKQKKLTKNACVSE